MSQLYLSALKQQHCQGIQIEVDEVFCFMCDIRSKFAADNAMPSRTMASIEFLLNVGSDILLYSPFVKSLHGEGSKGTRRGKGERECEGGSGDN